MPKSSKILLLVVSVVLAVTVLLGPRASGVSAASEQGDGAYRQINVYSEVLRHIQADYVEEPNIPQVTNGALRGLLESLDADSSYLSPNDYKAYKEAAKSDKGGDGALVRRNFGTGNKAQVGMIVSKRFGYATVVSVVPGSPADKANFTDGDILEAISGVDTRDLSLAMIQMMLEGKPGSEVTVAVVRPRKAAPDKITMTRTVTMEPPVQESVYENSTIIYLKPEILDAEHVAALEGKLKASQKGGQKKVLLDLRDVAAGDMSEAVRVANFFLKTGTIATLEGQKVDKQTFTADPARAIDPAGPLVVLVNRGTAGPGELVAAALLDDKRADLVGEKTFGEGAQQKMFELPDGAALILSVAKYASPSGKKLQDDAVTPGVLVASNIGDAADEDADEDATPGNATGAASAATVVAKPKPSVTVDDQLTKALDLLKAKAA
jgi:carboxyl-terminal processing protease